MRGEKEGKGIVWKEREGRADKRCLLNPKSRDGGWCMMVVRSNLKSNIGLLCRLHGTINHLVQHGTINHH